MSDINNTYSANGNEYDVIASVMRLSRAMRRHHTRPPFGNCADFKGHGSPGEDQSGIRAKHMCQRPGTVEQAGDQRGIGEHRMPPPPPPEGIIRLMKALSSNDGASSRELSELLDIRPSSLTELLARAERQGVITRTPDETDKRVVRVKLSDDGKKTLETMEDHRRSHLEQITSCFTADETAQFCRLCDKLSDHIESLAKENGDFENERGRGPRPPFGGGHGGMRGGHGGMRHGHGHGHMAHMPPPPFGDMPDDYGYDVPSDEKTD